MTSVFDDPDKIEKKDDKHLQQMINYFCAEFKKQRKEVGISQNKLSKLAGVSQKMISIIEAGENFKIDTYIKMCRGIGLEPRVRFVKHRTPKKKMTYWEKVVASQ